VENCIYQLVDTSVTYRATPDDSYTGMRYALTVCDVIKTQTKAAESTRIGDAAVDNAACPQPTHTVDTPA